MKNSNNEFIQHLHEIQEAHMQLSYLRYFTGLAAGWYLKIRNKRCQGSVVIVGFGIPEELVMACKVVPVRVLGGSQEACAWSDDLVPRDTDPVSRSLMGYIRCMQGKKNLYIISSGSDSMRKIAYQLIRDGEKVCVVDVPPVREDTASLEKWNKQLIRMMETVTEHVKGHISSASLKEAVRKTVKARLCLNEFMTMAPEYDRNLSAAARILIQNSYYYAQDLEEWTVYLRRLMREIRLKCSRTAPWLNEKPKVLLMGSPVCFPNYKVPALLEEAGLCIWDQVDAAENIRCIIPRIRKNVRSLNKMVSIVASAWYGADISSAYIKNVRMRMRIRKLAGFSQIEGTVCLVLKGQIEQDFELAYCEKMLEIYNIPVFRLETDYQYQDVEQLRIRMEAFAEMLTQNRYRDERNKEAQGQYSLTDHERGRNRGSRWKGSGREKEAM